MKLFPTHLRKPSLPMAVDMPVREIDIKATWNGDENTPLDVEILYQFNALSHYLMNLLEHDHPAVLDFSIEYLDGHVNKTITKNSENLQHIIDSALRGSASPSIESPTLQIPKRHGVQPGHSPQVPSSTYNRYVSSLIDPADLLVDALPGFSSPSDSLLGLPDIDGDLSMLLSPLPSPVLAPSPSPSSIAELPWASSSEIVDFPASTNLEAGFEESTDTMTSDLDVSDHHIIVHNNSDAFKQFRILIRASIMLQLASSGRGFVFTVPGLAQFLATSSPLGSFTLNFTSPSALSNWFGLELDGTAFSFTKVIQSCVFNAREGYSLRLLRPEDFPIFGDDDSLLSPGAGESEVPAACLCSRLRAFTASLFGVLFTVLSTAFSAVWSAFCLVARHPWCLIKASLLLWLCCRAFLHEGTLAFESRAVSLCSFAAPAPPPPPPPPPPMPPIEVVEVVDGPVSARDWFDYALGWKGPKGTWR